jgi:hypothetical protein
MHLAINKQAVNDEVIALVFHGNRLARRQRRLAVPLLLRRQRNRLR